MICCAEKTIVVAEASAICVDPMTLSWTSQNGSAGGIYLTSNTATKIGVIAQSTSGVGGLGFGRQTAVIPANNQASSCIIYCKIVCESTGFSGYGFAYPVVYIHTSLEALSPPRFMTGTVFELPNGTALSTHYFNLTIPNDNTPRYLSLQAYADAGGALTRATQAHLEFSLTPWP